MGTPKPVQDPMEVGGGRGGGGGLCRGRGELQGIGRGGGHLLLVRVHTGQTLVKTEYWDQASGEVGHACNSRKRKKVGACDTV